MSFYAFDVFVLISCLSHKSYGLPDLYQYPNYYPVPIFNDSNSWLKVYSNNCSFISTQLFIIFHQQIAFSCEETQVNDVFPFGWSYCTSAEYACNSTLTQIYYKSLDFNSLLNNSNNIYAMYLFNNSVTNVTSLKNASKLFPQVPFKVLTIYNILHDAANGYEYYLYPDNNCVLIQVSFTFWVDDEYDDSTNSLRLLPAHLTNRSIEYYVLFVTNVNGSMFGMYGTIYSCISPDTYHFNSTAHSMYQSNCQCEISVQSGYDICFNHFDETLYDNTQSMHSDCSISKTFHISNKNTISYKINLVETFVSRYFINIGDSFIVLCLTITNVIAAVFIIIGLKLYQLNDKQKNDFISEFVILYIMYLLLLIITSYGSYLPYSNCLSSTSFTMITQTDFIYTIFLCSVIRFVLFIIQNCHKCYVSFYYIWWLVVAISLMLCIKAIQRAKTENYYLIWTSIFTLTSLMFPPFWMYFICQFRLSYCCCGCKCTNGKCVKCCRVYLLFPLMAVIIFAVAYYVHFVPSVYTVGTSNYRKYISGSDMKYAPCLLVIPIGLNFIFFMLSICSKLMLQIILWLALLAFTSVVYYFYQIWVQLMIAVFIVPVMVISLFSTLKPLNTFTSNVISIYLIIFDLSTDILLCYYWYLNNNYVWCLLRILFFLIGQIFGAFINFTDAKLSFMERLFILFGVGRPLFLIKSWYKPYYKKEYQRIKLWEIMYTSFPFCVLQLYIILIVDDYSVQVIQSIVVTFICTTFEIIQYLSAVATSVTNDNHINNKHQSHNSKAEPLLPPINIQQECECEREFDVSPELSINRSIGNVQNTNVHQKTKAKEREFNVSHELSINRSIRNVQNTNVHQNTKAKKGCIDKMLQKYSVIINNKALFIFLYLFILSDFYIRSLPFVTMISGIYYLFDQNAALSFCVVYVVIIGIYEWILNQLMRKITVLPKQNVNATVCKIFLISILSSFYNILCCLKCLKDHPFFGKFSEIDSSLFFNREHKQRLILSNILFIVSSCVFVITQQAEDPLKIALMAFYIVFLAINIITMKYLKHKM